VTATPAMTIWRRLPGLVNAEKLELKSVCRVGVSKNRCLAETRDPVDPVTLLNRLTTSQSFAYIILGLLNQSKTT
jgi:hypothetical protein